ncbi:hypothetical protein, partial [Klebsiella pneumoniae]|uniref:hypothetical protein n=1 Tax=Klebsiella pneumoniae TaxID=573 RepID=UPI003F7D8B4B
RSNSLRRMRLRSLAGNSRNLRSRPYNRNRLWRRLLRGGWLRLSDGRRHRLRRDRLLHNRLRLEGAA